MTPNQATPVNAPSASSFQVELPNRCVPEQRRWVALRSMQNLIALTCCCFAFLSGCGGKRYTTGRGDVGQFILQHVLAYGGRPVTTNGLPVIRGDWKYAEDEFGIGIVLPSSQYQSVQDFVRAAFGPPSNSAGWSA